MAFIYNPTNGINSANKKFCIIKIAMGGQIIYNRISVYIKITGGVY